MNKLLSCILSGIFLFQFLFPVLDAAPSQDIFSTISVPNTPEFSSLKKIITAKFSPRLPENNGYGYNCIFSGKLCPNYKYTSIDEKALKLILIKTYNGNESLYNQLYTTAYPEDFDISDGTATSGMNILLSRVPRGASATILDQDSYSTNSVASDLLDASFGVDFMSQNTSSLLSAIEQKIKDMKRTKCTQGDTGVNRSNNCPWNGAIADIYLPTPDELYAESIFLNGNSIKIGTLKDEIEYSVSSIDDVVTRPRDDADIEEGEMKLYTVHRDGYLLFSNTQSTYRSSVENCKQNKISYPNNNIECVWGNTHITSGMSTGTITLTKRIITGYILRYKKDSYTLDETKGEINKKNVSNEEFLVSNNRTPEQLPCQQYTGYLVLSQCTAARSTLFQVITALSAYYLDTNSFPSGLHELNQYLGGTIPSGFVDNFSYKTTKDIQGQPDYEIRYIGSIGEKVADAIDATGKKDYNAMMSGMVVPEIPRIFSYVPADSMVLYVKNPANLVGLLEYKDSDNTDVLFSTHKSIQNFVFSYFGIKDIEQLETNLTHELAIVVTNMDATAPDIVLILSEADKGALSPTATTQAVSMRDGYVFVASSKDSLERVMSLTEQESVKDAPDFHYVWTKKADSIQDAFVFVGDAFFEKMLTVENYILHARKYADYKNLRALQELVWAYKDAFGSAPKSLSEISQLGLTSLTGSVLDSYALQGDRVQHKNIGTLDSLNTINESGYNLSQISRAEIDTYKYNVLKYREVWRAALDPMGIVLNRYGDGIDIDFFMTPIPDLQDNDLAELREFFEGTTKDSLSFVMDNRVRMGLLSFVGGFDIDKIQKKILTNPEIEKGFAEFSKEVLDGKDIFDYIGGEFAFTLGDIDADILDGWNVDKVDMYLSVQVASEEKGKELVEAMRMNMLEKTNGVQSSELDMAKGFFAKPLIEEYAGKKIYYIDGASVPFVGKLGIAYTFVNDFFYIGLNRQTIKNIIDITNTGDSRKKEIVGTDAIQKNTFFAILFDGVQTSNTIKALYEKNQKTLPRYLNSLGLGASSSNSQIGKLLGTYYATQDTNKRLGKKVTPFDYTVGGLTVAGDIDRLTVRIDENVLTSLTGEILEDWNRLRVSDGFQSGVLLNTGIPLEQFLNMDGVDDIIAMSLMVSLQNKFDSGESLLKNTVFSLSMGDDEIGFKVRIFEKREDTRSKKSLGSIIPEDIPQDVFVIILILVALLLVGGIGYVLYKKKESEDSASPISQNPSSLTSPVVSATSSPIDITQPPLPPTGSTENL